MYTALLKRPACAILLLALAACAPPLSSPNPAPVTAQGLDAARAASAPVFRVFTVGSTRGLPKTAVPRDLVVAADGTVWFTDINTPAIGSISPSLRVREYRNGLISGSQPYSIVVGPDANLWFTDEGGAIGRITPSGTIAEFRTKLGSASVPEGIAAGKGGKLWSIAVGPPSYVLKITTAGKISKIALPNAMIPDGSLAIDGNGDGWFFASRPDHRVVLLRIRRDGRFRSYGTGLTTIGEPCCPNLAPKHVAIGADGNPWFTTPYFRLASSPGRVVGTFANAAPTFYDVKLGAITYPIYPSGIVSTRNYLWYAGSDPLSFNGALWRMTLTGKQTAYPIDYDPAGLAAAGSKVLWFTSQAQGRPPAIVRATFP